MIITEEHTKEENALIVENYPYGFKKTKIRYWIETKGNKQRAVSQTLNPKTNKWNNIKPSTYSDLIIMYKEKETDYIKFYHYSLTYSDLNDFEKLLNFLGDYKTPYIETFLKVCRAVYETRKSVKISIRAVKFRNIQTGEIKESITSEDNFLNYEEIKDTEEEKAKEKQVSEDLHKIFFDNAKKEGLSIEELKQTKILK